MSRSLPYRAFLLCCLLWQASSRLPAQTDYPYSVSQFEFVDYAASVLQMPGRPDAMAHVFGKMDALFFRGLGQVNIVHIGGSHVQADMWSDRMRQRLQTSFGGVRGARGMIFPFRMARTNNPYNYLTEYTGTWEACKNIQASRSCTLGLTGYSVTSYDTLSQITVTFRGGDAPRYDFNRVRIFHDLDSSAYSVRILADGKPVFSQAVPQQGYTLFQLGLHHQVLQLEIRKTDSLQNHFTLYGISLDNDDPGFIYHAIGVNGASTGSYRRCALFTRHLTALQPDLVVFSIGINDANTTDFDQRGYELNYDTLVARVRTANPYASILFTTNTDSYYKKKYPNKNAAAVRDVMLRLAKRHNAAVWDAWAVMGGLGSIKLWIKAGLANTDKVHMLKPGYELLADLLFNAIMQEYDKHLRQLYQNQN